MNTSSPLLDVRSLRTEFATSEGDVVAVDDVSFQIHHGEALGVVGESGSGKSMTALSILRLIKAPGSVSADGMYLDGRNIMDLDDTAMRGLRGSEVGMVFQDPMTSLNPVLTIGVQITEQLRMHLGLTQRQARKRAIELLDLVGIPDAADRLGSYPHQFSGGMRQRVMIAMAVSCDPKLLIADEATTALDVTIQAQIVDLMRRLRQELGMAVMWISHDLGVIAGFCDRVQVMYAGRIVESAPVNALFAQPSHGYSRGLLASVPRLDSRNKRLQPIPGSPPNLIGLDQRCPFQPRCRFAIDDCNASAPPTRVIGEGHTAQCWVDMQREPDS